MSGRLDYDDYFGNAPIGLHCVAGDGTILDASNAELELLGYSREEYVGRDIRAFHVDRAVIEDILARLHAGETILGRRLWMQSRAGAQVPVVFSANGVWRGGRLDYYRGLIREISGELAIERQLADLLAREQTLRREAEATNRAKDEFLAMLGHELRNPLAAVSAAAQLLGRTAGADAEAAHDVIRRQVKHLAALVDDLLDVARVTTGKISLVRRPVDLAALAERVVHAQRAQPSVGRRALALEASPVWVDGDETRLEQILVNLLGNALKFTREDGRVALSVHAERGEAVVRVADDGEGIAPELLPRIFELFVQGETRLQRPRGGLGIGLTLVRRLAELHGGAIEAASEGAGRGAVFTLRLPQIAPAAAARRAEPAPPTPRRVLIVEDNPDARAMLALLLRIAGHEVREAADATAGIAALAAWRPEVALVDIGMPGMSGYEFARRVRAEGGSQPYLVALTGYGLAEDRARALQAGFDAHLVKPAQAEALAAVLAAAPRAASVAALRRA